METTDWIAAYAAIVATAAFAWQAVTYWVDQRPKLLLQPRPGIIVIDRSGAATLVELQKGKQCEPTGLTWYFDLRIVNRGRARVQVNGLRIKQATENPRHVRGWDGGQRIELPLWLEAGEERSFRFTDNDLQSASTTSSFTVTVTTSAGRDFRTTVDLINPDAHVSISRALLDPLLKGADISEEFFVLEVEDMGSPHEL